MRERFEVGRPRGRRGPLAARNSRIRGLLNASLFVLLAPTACGDEVHLDHVSPLAIRPGVPTRIVVQGSGLGRPTALWTNFPVTVRPESGDSPEQDRAEFLVHVPASVAPQIGGLRAISDTGISNLRLLVVDDLPTEQAREEITTATTAQSIERPIACEGTIQPTQSHWYRFEGRAGETVAFEVLAARLGSALDPQIVVTHHDGRVVVEADDDLGLGGDCRIACTLPEDGSYFVSIRDAAFAGGDGHRYRLRIGRFPIVREIYPLGVRRGGVDELEVADALGPRFTTRVRAPQSAGQACLAVRRDSDDASAMVHVVVSELVEHREIEPNDGPHQARRRTLPCAINGRLDRPGDRDWLRFELKSGESLRVAPRHVSFGVPTRLFLRLYDAERNQLADATQVGSRQGALEFRAERDMPVWLAVEELHRRASPHHVYRLELTTAVPRFDLSVAADSYFAPHAGVFVANVSVARHEWEGPVRLEVDGIARTALRDNLIAADQSETQLKVHLPASIDPGQLRRFTITGHAHDNGVRNAPPLRARALAELSRPFQHVEFPPREWSEDLALRIGAPFPPFFELRPGQQRLWAPQGHNRLALMVAANRLAEFEGGIELAATDLPAGVEVNAETIAAGRSEATVSLSGLAQLKEGDYAVGLRGQATFQHQPGAFALRSIPLRIGSPLEVRAADSPATVAGGTTHTIRIHAVRHTDDNQPIVVSAKLPAGVTARLPVTIPSGASEIDVPLDIDANVPEEFRGELVFTATTQIAPPQQFAAAGGPLGEQLTGREIAKIGALREAESFDRGNASKLDTGYGEGIGIISDPGSQENFAEYDLDLPVAGRYQVELRYAALESRPGRILVNGEVVKEDAVSGVTGGWNPEDQQWHIEGVFEFVAGKNVLRIESQPLMSHIDKVLVVRSGPRLVASPSFDSWIIRNTATTAGSLDGNLVSVFATDNSVTPGTARFGIIEFDITRLAGARLQAAHLELAVDGRDNHLARGATRSVARLLPHGTDAAGLSGQAYADQVDRLYYCETFAAFAIENEQSAAAGDYEMSQAASPEDIAELQRRIDEGHTKLVVALEAVEDGSATARDWAADDAAPRGTHGGPLPPRLVFDLTPDAGSADGGNEVTVTSNPVTLSVAE